MKLFRMLRDERREASRRRARRTRRGWVAAGIGAFIAAVGAGVVLFRTAVPRLLPGLSAPGATSPAGEKVTLYFADPQWTLLFPEQREIPVQGDVAARIRTLVAALAEGPRAGGAPVLPDAARIRNAYLGRDGLAVIDFEPGATELGAGGASGELLTVLALVHTISANVPGVRSVQILVGGEERENLAGHVKISEPIAPDPKWVSALPK